MGNVHRRGPVADGLISVYAYFPATRMVAVFAAKRPALYTAARYMPVPYDFDWSGVVFTRYATTDPRLGIRTVQERLFRVRV